MGPQFETYVTLLEVERCCILFGMGNGYHKQNNLVYCEDLGRESHKHLFRPATTAGGAFGVRLPSAAVLTFSKDKTASSHILKKLLSPTVCRAAIRNHIHCRTFFFFLRKREVNGTRKTYNMIGFTSGKEHLLCCQEDFSFSICCFNF